MTPPKPYVRRRRSVVLKGSSRSFRQACPPQLGWITKRLCFSFSEASMSTSTSTGVWAAVLTSMSICLRIIFIYSFEGKWQKRKCQVKQNPFLRRHCQWSGVNSRSHRGYWDVLEHSWGICQRGFVAKFRKVVINGASLGFPVSARPWRRDSCTSPTNQIYD